MKTTRHSVHAILALAILAACQPRDADRDTESSSAPEGAVEPDMPNIVLVIADDFGAPNHSFLGADYMKTPNLDALAASGIVFGNGYTPANHCRPSLRSIATGLLPIQYEALEARNRAAFMESAEYLAMSPEEQRTWSDNYQFHSMKDIQTLPGILADHGYLTWQGGKWWEFTYENGGFTHGMTTGWAPEDRDSEGWFLQFMGGDGRDLARVSCQAAYDFVDEAGDRPFFIWYAPELPHYPFDAPQKYYDIYKDEEMSESAKLYYANASWFDDRLGEFLGFLREKDELDNTLIVYVNDNGWEQEPHQEFVGDEMRFHNGGDKGKLGMYDQSFRTPIVFVWPGRIAVGQTREELIHAADIAPTILDYLGLEAPPDIYGRSYQDVISGTSTNSREEIIGRVTQLRWEGDMMGRKARGYWLRRSPWYFSWDLDTGETRLFDVEADPRSENDLAEDNEGLVADFKQRISRWRSTYEN